MAESGSQKSEISGAILLFAAVILAIAISNSPWAHIYTYFLKTPFTIQMGNFKVHSTLTLMINEGLMTVFFLLIGLVIKRELSLGALKNKEQLILPIAGALGGFFIPMAIYMIFNWDHPIAFRGWAIPAATDIAFSLGLLALLGSRVPITLKIFLTALAIIDDVEAILVIALFYSNKFSLLSLGFVALSTLVLVIINAMKFKQRSLYYFIGVLLWLAMLGSGIHATLAGIILAFTIPIEEHKRSGVSPLIFTERALVPWVNFLVLPLFAFANTGLAFSGITLSNFFNPITVGIILGLFIGKQLGIFSICWLLVKWKIAKLPYGVDWVQLYAVSIICGIGFTMSLFIGFLAFESFGDDYARSVRTGVLAGSVICGTIGYLILRLYPLSVKEGTK